jgi:ubiquinone/menaquinone biosynthesis C-methylase UbiE
MTYSTGTALVNVHELFSRAHMEPGMHIADFGCGRTGHTVFPAAKIIGEHGVVYAVDILKDVLSIIKKRADLEAFINIQPVWADIERSGGVAIPRGSLDIVFMINILYHVENFQEPLQEAYRLLKPKGRLVIIDWSNALGYIGPQHDKKLDFDAVERCARERQFGLQDDFSLNEYLRALVLFRHD